MSKTKTSSSKTRRRRGVRSRGSCPPRTDAPLPGQHIVRSNGVVEMTTCRISPRRMLRSGDVIRVRKGPYWSGRAEDGTPVRIGMAEKGRFTFQKYCTFGRSCWVEATNDRGVVVLHVGQEEPSAAVPGLVRRPYVITKLRKKTRDKGHRAP